MKWYHMAIIAACVIAGAVVGVIASREFHTSILVAPLIALANGVSVYLVLKRRTNAKRS